MQTIFEQLSQLPGSIAGAFQANFFPREIARNQPILKQLIALHEQVVHAHDEGVYEVTVRSRTQCVTVLVNPETGQGIAQDLFTLLGEQAQQAAIDLNDAHSALAAEGESADRIKLLALLLTPVDQHGYALPTTSEASTCPLLPSACICEPAAQ